MHEGLAILAAVLFASIGVGYASAARRGLSMIPFVAVASSTASLVSAALALRWGLLSDWRGELLLAGWVGVAGIFGQVGMALSGQAMKVGPRRTASTWTIFQMAMVVPFLVATLSGREQAAWYQWLALPAVLRSVAALAPRQSSGVYAVARGQSEDGRGRWLFFIAAAFLCAGTCQALLQEISLRKVLDPLHLRAPVALGSAGVFLWTLTALRGERASASHWRLGMFTGVLVAVGNITAFAGLDGLSQVDRTCLFYPIAVGGSILLYATFQLFAWRETFDRRRLAGLACGLLGVMLLALKGLLALGGG